MCWASSFLIKWIQIGRIAMRMYLVLMSLRSSSNIFSYRVMEIAAFEL